MQKRVMSRRNKFAWGAEGNFYVDRWIIKISFSFCIKHEQQALPTQLDSLGSRWQINQKFQVAQVFQFNPSTISIRPFIINCVKHSSFSFFDFDYRDSSSLKVLKNQNLLNYSWWPSQNLMARKKPQKSMSP